MELLRSHTDENQSTVTTTDQVHYQHTSLTKSSFHNEGQKHNKVPGSSPAKVLETPMLKHDNLLENTGNRITGEPTILFSNQTSDYIRLEIIYF
jgi:hypothetical protein